MRTTGNHTHHLVALVLALLLLYAGVVAQVATDVLATGDGDTTVVEAGFRAP
ncbi:hypothetical protein [Pseudactinotalea suaedae]|uniref:hypothetical protein n=1 Tax=Pseudactinotalea suaedae TaxID=1524924 RepID=UPI0012E1D85B|nr:hypothetical protein [Pseudactinotalea suaedae]